MKLDLDFTFRKLVPSEPYPFQLEVAKQIFANERVILRAPTGAGKTWTALLPFLHAKLNKQVWADRLIYAVPLRTLGKTLYESTQKALDEAFPGAFKVTMQTGDTPMDPYFQGDIIFCTIDQLLSLYIGHPYAVGIKQSNVLAGVMSGAYLVFDEVHLLDITKAFATTLDAVRRYRNLAPALIMTATLSDALVEEAAKRCQATAIRVGDKELRHIRQRLPVQRYYQRRDEPMQAKNIVNEHQEWEKTLVMVNTVERAMTMYQEIKQICQEEGREISLWLLHARFLPRHRAHIERRIIDLFCKGGEGTGIIVATQVLEAGVDFSVDVLHSELAPANALIQRAGRVARYGGIGRIYVYDVWKTPEKPSVAETLSNVQSTEKRRDYAPYFNEKNDTTIQLMMDQTWDDLLTLCPGPVDYREELAWVNRIHSRRDQKRMARRSSKNVADDVVRAMDSPSNHCLRELVRDAPSRYVLIHSNPQTLDMRKAPDLFAVRPNTLQTVLDKHLEKGDCWGFTLIDKGQRWEKLRDSAEAARYMIIALSPKLAFYSSEVGLQLGQSGTFESQENLHEVPKEERYSYRCETLLHHLQLTVKEYTNQVMHYQAAQLRWSKVWSCLPEDVEWVGRVACAGHDMGKACVDWSKWAQRYQASVSGQPVKDLLAHTDFDPQNEHMRKEQYRSGKRPSHSLQGAWWLLQTLSLLYQGVGDEPTQQRMRIFALVIFTAIARHHGAFTQSLDADASIAVLPDPLVRWLDKVFQLPSDKNDHAAAPRSHGSVADKVPWQCYKKDAEKIRKQLFTPRPNGIDEYPFLFSLYVVRRLRLADWDSQRIVNFPLP
ncbi:CRISPR-associated helicase Cas3' [Heliophilum fasciatum]|uniref:CRISPR-associated Cas3 family helicase n=1 Tax=Heliophilum fasciatum TaxID=35700 RepID=A0A4R2RH31_9FIRM|nr:CRISPR-associated helicase Cas3' [Heliophilum fasciatum]MCW2279024.1 CRISPR-associated endonuclease/helicase Cas3 [Heliophilum fasciatum]TCP61739.1 CRISPR-associated Cas3 family helicase [Heliophilum fasciatum]